MRVLSALRKRPLAAAIGAVLVIAAFAFAIHWFKPHYAFIDRTASDPALGSTTTLASGTFSSLEHTTSGKAVLMRLPDGKRVLRLEDLKTSNGPELRVYLSSIPAQDDWFVYDDGPFVDLGDLKGNVGSSNYELPSDIDDSKYRSAVVWCRRFSVGFGVAPLVRD